MAGATVPDTQARSLTLQGLDPFTTKGSGYQAIFIRNDELAPLIQMREIFYGIECIQRRIIVRVHIAFSLCFFLHVRCSRAGPDHILPPRRSANR